jgi:hypothetical protein
MSPKLSLILAYLKFPLRDNSPKNSFGIFGGWVHLQYLLGADRGNLPCLQGEIVTPISFPWGSFRHRCLKYCPAQSRFLMDILAIHGEIVFL